MDHFPALPTDEAMAAFDNERLVNGYVFPMRVTSIGMPQTLMARVRRLNTIDDAALRVLPQELQQTVFDGLKEFQKAQRDSADMPEPENMDQMFANNEKILKTASLWCTAAFINPVLHSTVEERNRAADKETDPGIRHWHVERVAKEDRIAIFVMCMDSDSAYLDKLKTFRPGPASHVPNGATDEADAPAAERHLEVVG